MTGGEIIGLLGTLLSIATQIINLAGSAQRNVEKCKLLRDRVRMIKRIVIELEKNKTSKEWLNELVESLNSALSDGRDLVESCQEKRTWSRVFKTQKKANKFDALQKRISMILKMFPLANTILISTLNNGRFFENVLRKLLQDGACKRLPQNVKEELKSSIRTLTNIDNMPADERELLELIKSDITYRDGATSGSSGAQRGNDLTVAIRELTERIKQQDWMQSGDDIRRLVQLVQQVGNIIQHPQTSVLVLDPKTRPTLLELEEDLQRISERFPWYKLKKPNKIKSAMRCGPDNDNIIDEVLKEAYKMEYYITVLPAMVLRQFYAFL